MSKQCVVCQDSHNKVIFKEFDIDILKCQSCGHVFSSYQLDQNYDGYFPDQIKSEEQYWWNEAHEKIYTDFCNRYLKGKNGRLLDVGCGLGFFVKKISSYSGWQTVGYEISPSAVKFARNKLKLKNVYLGKVEQSNLPKNYFDIITLWDVIEHIPNPHPLISYLHSVLKKDGLLFIHTPNILNQLPKARLKKLIKGTKKGVYYLESKDHVNIYSPQTIKKVLQRNGFNRIEFVHFHPIQSMAGSKNPFSKLAKNWFFYFTRMVDNLTLGQVNVDNLFVIAKK
ncbi:MAG: Methionine biosynthesis protein MetW-like protein [Candidatus Daviesbacteria bacterium GW2011_GWA1_41_61]|uniref:Methionine biosynthesis protein MetW-like protein n=1 Tax=Candidatus Daviesbacteria bacterium GW2011_GWA2_40_9 TaxID=1618424 RepID=A0A0G0X3K5_9BACT|nr:MAG: Methylase/methyltransferase [Candidatus Daviesbacteria bacterium GW2011_GWC1_40_9]KKR82182.1 MAG: Methionine biosynthesis protein MetW-like protein [Candidatus Daviesbacteria bacterium GW2011_GWA2_40_9]KKR93626.1 MAG: Methionine biosynthesis protein MetW-like protein [Candidatus Daviesbacteria bacterium GW2011_GWB1_41_15]KKS14823.1 MAG: Methionine biosynthesis protein MetW-like protein [Candidatus Daviesbacteria bacterium GW2011_GWA1_41_61]